ncbi:MAG: outer membrane lipoprotein carrier protein LolA [Taibaiella sp.]|nr:outer membrane lipoprotein carrier protein LolA [Taibaiella sp.]
MKFLFSLSLVFAACITQVVYAQNDPKAKAVLDGATKKISSLKTLKANFVLKLSGGKGNNVTDTRKGGIALKGQKYRMSLGATEVISDNVTVWTYNKEAKEVQVAKNDPSAQTMSPVKLLSPSFFEKEYTYSYKGERKEGGKNCDIVELTPHDKSKQLAKIELVVDKGTSMIVGGNYWEKNGNKYAVTISNIVQNADIPDAQFGWNPKEHPGVEVVDLR